MTWREVPIFDGYIGTTRAALDHWTGNCLPPVIGGLTGDWPTNNLDIMIATRKQKFIDGLQQAIDNKDTEIYGITYQVLEELITQAQEIEWSNADQVKQLMQHCLELTRKEI